MFEANNILIFLILIFFGFIIKLLKEKNIFIENNGVWQEYKNDKFYSDDTSKIFFASFPSLKGDEYVEINEDETLEMHFKSTSYHNYEVYAISPEKKVIKSYFRPKNLCFNKLNLKKNKYLFILRVNEYDLYSFLPEYKMKKSISLSKGEEEKNINILEEIEDTKYDNVFNKIKKDMKKEKIKKYLTSENVKSIDMFPSSENVIIRKINLVVKQNDTILFYSKGRTDIDNIKQTISISTKLPIEGNNMFFDEKYEKETISLKIPDQKYFTLKILNDYDTPEEEYEIIEKIYNTKGHHNLLPFKVIVCSSSERERKKIQEENEVEDDEDE
jgi:hypothetical protein